MPFIQVTPDSLAEGGAKYSLQSVDSLEEEIRQSLLKMIARGAKSSGKLREAMLAKDYPAQLVDQLIERFTEVCLIDDFQMAKDWVQSQLSRKAAAKSVLAMTLREKGFPAEAITSALSEIDPEAELEAAKKIAVSRIRQLMKLEPDVRSRRLASFLTRKGYSSSIVWIAVKHASSTPSD
ncbi:MAG: regulatory protein RecX [Rhodoluna sp.]|jgi:regulatory protein|nr:regulatory protein RecX [Rhodoluna sp.]